MPSIHVPMPRVSLPWIQIQKTQSWPPLIPRKVMFESMSTKRTSRSRFQLTTVPFRPSVWTIKALCWLRRVTRAQWSGSSPWRPACLSRRSEGAQRRQRFTPSASTWRVKSWHARATTEPSTFSRFSWILREACRSPTLSRRVPVPSRVEPMDNRSQRRAKTQMTEIALKTRSLNWPSWRASATTSAASGVSLGSKYPTRTTAASRRARSTRTARTWSWSVATACTTWPRYRPIARTARLSIPRAWSEASHWSCSAQASALRFSQNRYSTF